VPQVLKNILQVGPEVGDFLQHVIAAEQPLVHARVVAARRQAQRRASAGAAAVASSSAALAWPERGSEKKKKNQNKTKTNKNKKKTKKKQQKPDGGDGDSASARQRACARARMGACEEPKSHTPARLPANQPAGLLVSCLRACAACLLASLPLPVSCLLALAHPPAASAPLGFGLCSAKTSGKMRSISRTSCDPCVASPPVSADPDQSIN
jgi:hypothetical protein